MNSKWKSLARIVIVLLTLVLFVNAMSLFVELRREVTRANRPYGLSTINDYFEDGMYYDIYETAIKNELSTDKPEVDTSQYEAFGRYYHWYLLARMYPDVSEYRQNMAKEKSSVTWNKIINVMDNLEKELN